MTSAAPPFPPTATGTVPGAEGVPAAVRPDREGAEVARIFDELRGLAGCQVVPLLYRVLATDPAALGWSWNVLAPAFRQGQVAAVAAAAIAALAGRRFGRLPAPAYAVLGLGPADLSEARAVVRGFNHANPQNLAALMLLDQALREGAVAEHAPPEPGFPKGASPGGCAAAPPPEAADLPHRLPLELQALPADQAALVTWLSTRGGREPVTITPTLWRCLAHWPPLLVLAAARLEPLHAGGAVEDAVQAIRRAVAEALRSRPGTASIRRGIAAAAPDQAAHVRRTVDLFADKVPEMIFTGLLLHHLLAED